MQQQFYQVKPEHIDLFVSGLLLTLALIALYVITRIMARHPVFILLLSIGSIGTGITALLIPTPYEQVNGIYAVLLGCFLMLVSAFAYRSAKQ